MPISLVTRRVPESCRPSRSTITRSDDRRQYLLTPVGVASNLSRSSRADKFPDVPGINPSRYNHLLYRTISRLNRSSEPRSCSFNARSSRNQATHAAPTKVQEDLLRREI